MQINPSCGESLKQNYPSEKASILQVQPCLASLSHLVICQKEKRKKNLLKGSTWQCQPGDWFWNTTAGSVGHLCRAVDLDNAHRRPWLLWGNPSLGFPTVNCMTEHQAVSAFYEAHALVGDLSLLPCSSVSSEIIRGSVSQVSWPSHTVHSVAPCLFHDNTWHETRYSAFAIEYVSNFWSLPF